jgi:dipeptidyl aminopeptidase/acylaminoacyl peptidase
MNETDSPQPELKKERRRSWPSIQVLVAILMAVVIGLYLIGLIASSNGSFKWADKQPSWSPDGREIAFASDRADPEHQIFSIYVMKLGEDSSIRVSPEGVTSTGNTGRPIWSPNGHQLAYAVWDRTTLTELVHVVNADGSGDRTLTSSAEVGHGINAVEWSPNGRWLALDTCADPCVSHDLWGLRTQLYVVHPNGHGLRRIATKAYRFAWSPDGTRLVYAAPRKPRGESLYVRQIATGKETRLTDLNMTVTGIAWSPDSSRIAVAGGKLFVDWVGNVFDRTRVLTVENDGGAKRVIARVGSTRDWINVAWLPHPDRVLYYKSCDASGIYEASTVRPSGRTIAKDGCDATPSPDGKHVAFIRGHTDSRSGIFLVRLNNGSVSQVPQLTAAPTGG